MNNSILINNLKHKGIIRNIKSNTEKNDNDKFNPDVIKTHDILDNRRKTTSFEYTNNVWKPIIGSINKQNINADDFKIPIIKPDPIQILSNYEAEMNNRKKEAEIINKKITEMELAKKETEIINKESNPEQVNKEIETKKEVKQEPLINDISNSFIELKNSSQNIFKNSNNINTTAILESMTKLDELLNSIKNI